MAGARSRKAPKQAVARPLIAGGSKEAAGNAAGDSLLNLFLVIAVAIALAIGGLSYISGSAPEWVALKSSVGLVGIGLVGWVISTVVSAGLVEKAEDNKGGNVDVTLPQTAPAETRADNIATMDSATR